MDDSPSWLLRSGLSGPITYIDIDRNIVGR